MKTYEYLKPWSLPDSYFGAQWSDYFVFLGQNRDSDSLTRSNFIVGLKELGGESETVIVVRERHWACGWIEWIAIHKDHTEALNKAESMLKKIDSYPILNEDHFTELEYDEFMTYMLDEFGGDEELLSNYINETDSSFRIDEIDWSTVARVKQEAQHD